jgi:hypothetical protein
MSNNEARETNTVFARELQFDVKSKTYPRYSYNKIAPVSGVSSITMDTAGSQTLEFLLPNVVFNPAKSKLNFRMTYAAGANVHVVPKDTVALFQRCEIRTQSGINIGNYEYLPRTNALAWRLQSRQAMLENAKGSGQQVAAGSLEGAAVKLASVIEGVQACSVWPSGNALVAVATLTKSGPLSVNVATDATQMAEGPAHYPGRLEIAPVAGLTPHFSAEGMDTNCAYPQQFEMSATTNAGASNVALVHDFAIPLGNLVPFSVLCVDKDICFGEPLIIKLFTNSIAQCGFQYTLAEVAELFPVKLPYSVDLSADASAISVSGTLANPFLYMAVEQDREIVDAVMSAVNGSGLKILCSDYTYATQNITSTAGGTSSFSTRLSAKNGASRLKFVLLVPFNSSYNSFNLTEHCNRGAGKVSRIYTALNSQSLQNQQIDMGSVATPAYDDWVFMKSQLEGTTYTDVGSYRNRWFWADNFVGNSLKEAISADSENLEVGIDVSDGKDYSWNAITTFANTIAWTAIQVYQRTLVLKKGDIRQL